MKRLLAVVCVFVSGIIVGLVGHDLHMKHMFDRMHHLPPGEKGDFIVNRMQGELGLTEAQVNKIRPIIEEGERKMSELRDTFHPKMKEILDLSMEQVKKELTDEQKKELEKIHKRMKDKGPVPF